MTATHERKTRQALQQLTDIIERGLDNGHPMIVMVNTPDTMQWAQINCQDPPLMAFLLMEVVKPLLEQTAQLTDDRGAEFACTQARQRVNTAQRMLRLQFAADAGWPHND